MPSLPIPMFGALVLLFLFMRLWVVQRRLGPLAVLLGLCGLQTLIIALAQHYLVPGTRVLQPITATLIPPVAWLAYQRTAVRALGLRDGLHGLAPILATALLIAAPTTLDVYIPALFVVYGATLLLQAARGPDMQPRLALASGEVPARIWQVIGVALIASALSDVLIVAAQIGGAPHLRPWIISVYTVGNLILIGALSLSGHLDTGPEDEDRAAPGTPAPDEELWARIEQYMAERRPYLDPDLTLSKLSRRMGIPAKALSSTINGATGENVSRYVNRARIEAVQQALLAGEPVTSAMLSCGFNTKSNFNREFLRVAGSSPSQWLAAQSA